MKMMVKELDSHSFYVTFDTKQGSDIRRISFNISKLEDENISQSKTANFSASSLNDAQSKLEGFFEFENEATRNEVMKPLIKHFSQPL
jgi:LPS O-antigen subunit length determinant protein (WzzB/FepE family)